MFLLVVFYNRNISLKKYFVNTNFYLQFISTKKSLYKSCEHRKKISCNYCWWKAKFWRQRNGQAYDKSRITLHIRPGIIRTLYYSRSKFLTFCFCYWHAKNSKLYLFVVLFLGYQGFCGSSCSSCQWLCDVQSWNFSSSIGSKISQCSSFSLLWDL